MQAFSMKMLLLLLLAFFVKTQPFLLDLFDLLDFGLIVVVEHAKVCRLLLLRLRLQLGLKHNFQLLCVVLANICLDFLQLLEGDGLVVVLGGFFSKRKFGVCPIMPLSLFCPWLSLFCPWLSLFCPWLSLFCPSFLLNKKIQLLPFAVLI